VNVFVYDAASLAAILRALCRLPEPIRRFVAEECVVVSVGVVTAGLNVHPTHASGRNVIVIAEGRGDLSGPTFGHEVAHAVLGHSLGTVEAEREAAALCASWGFGGDGLTSGGAADPGMAAALLLTERANAPRMRAVTRDSSVRIECACGAACRVYAPTAVGLAATVGVECVVCGWVAVEPLARLVKCHGCGSTTTVRWSADATPELPRASWECTCGVSATLRLADPDAEAERPPKPSVPEELWHADRAARQLIGIEGSLRRLAAQAGDVSDAAESLRSGIAWSRSLLLRALRGLDAGDSRGSALIDADGELSSVAERLALRDLAGAADLVASAARQLDAVLTPAGIAVAANGGDA
jgi:hypothetical protein